MQSNYDLWQARQHVKLDKVGKFRLVAPSQPFRGGLLEIGKCIGSHF